MHQAFGTRLTRATPVRPVLAASPNPETLAGSPLIHVHNKVLIRDDAYGLIGLANLNGRSMHWDTELAVELTDTARVAKARSRLLSHWWHADIV